MTEGIQTRGRITAPAQVYWPALDGLRGLAIIAVLLHNTTGIQVDASLADKLWTFVVDAGWVGVQLFFVLSGFLITGILLRSRDKPHALRTFYTRRALRIFPLYYLFLLGRFLLVPLFLPLAAVSFGKQLPFWLYLSNWGDLLTSHPVVPMGHFWSLAVEEQFYLVWPALALIVPLRRFAWICGGIVLTALGFRIAMHLGSLPGQWMYESTITRADALAMGALVAIAFHDARGQEWFRRARKTIMVGACVGLACIMVFAHGLSRFEWLVQTLGYSLLAVVFAWLVAECATATPGGWRRWLALPWLRLIGKYSYAIYIVHVPVKYVLVHYAAAHAIRIGAAQSIMRDMAFIALVGVISFVIAALTFIVIERPILRFKQRTVPG
ncbi:MAG TPA: acyltransferase [Rhodanobacter sp.]|nr:acyltransferase [Rhodanobacter sp.]